jgi:diaminopimelate epimerase
MIVNFTKYHGTGNDFIIIDNRNGEYNAINAKQIKFMCDRHFGVGADGLMLLQNSKEHDFEMKYYNADGNESSMCGNGGRCITLYAQDLKIIRDKAIFTAIDGIHSSTIDDGEVELKMSDVNGIEEKGNDFVLNTGSPHYVQFNNNAKEINVNIEGAKIRNGEAFIKDGINVNFIEVLANKTLFVATFERGVEAETLSCGTGVVASALVHIREKIGGNYVRVSTKGGTLMVKCVNQNKQYFTDIYLCGSAKKVFEGLMIV